MTRAVVFKPNSILQSIQHAQCVDVLKSVVGGDLHPARMVTMDETMCNIHKASVKGWRQRGQLVPYRVAVYGSNTKGGVSVSVYGDHSGKILSVQANVGTTTAEKHKVVQRTFLREYNTRMKAGENEPLLIIADNARPHQKADANLCGPRPLGELLYWPSHIRDDPRVPDVVPYAPVEEMPLSQRATYRVLRKGDGAGVGWRFFVYTPPGMFFFQALEIYFGSLKSIIAGAPRGARRFSNVRGHAQLVEEAFRLVPDKTFEGCLRLAEAFRKECLAMAQRAGDEPLTCTVRDIEQAVADTKVAARAGRVSARRGASLGEKRAMLQKLVSECATAGVRIMWEGENHDQPVIVREGDGVHDLLVFPTEPGVLPEPAELDAFVDRVAAPLGPHEKQAASAGDDLVPRNMLDAAAGAAPSSSRRGRGSEAASAVFSWGKMPNPRWRTRQQLEEQKVELKKHRVMLELVADYKCEMAARRLAREITRDLRAASRAAQPAERSGSAGTARGRGGSGCDGDDDGDDDDGDDDDNEKAARLRARAHAILAERTSASRPGLSRKSMQGGLIVPASAAIIPLRFARQVVDLEEKREAEVRRLRDEEAEDEARERRIDMLVQAELASGNSDPAASRPATGAAASVSAAAAAAAPAPPPASASSFAAGAWSRVALQPAAPRAATVPPGTSRGMACVMAAGAAGDPQLPARTEPAHRAAPSRKRRRR